MHKMLGGDTTRIADPNWPKTYPILYEVMLSNKSWGKGRGRGRRNSEWSCLKWWWLSSQATVMHDGPLLSCKWLNICLLMGRSEWIPHFTLLMYVAFALPIKQSLSQPASFHTFALPILVPNTLRRVSKWLCVAELPTKLKPQHQERKSLW